MTETLLKKHEIISEQIEPKELSVILRECERMLQTAPMDAGIVEFGCYEGTTSLFLQRLIKALRPSVSLHVYDSFEGLPSKIHLDSSSVGELFVTGELKASKQALTRNFKRAHVPLPVIHKGWFKDVLPAEVPESIIFAFLDGDYYESIIDSLKLIWPKLLPGAVVIVDDYQNEALPGAERAVDYWLKRYSARLQVEASLAIIKPY